MTPRLRHLLTALMLSLAVLAPVGAAAVQPGEMLKDPKLEARAREISKGLRCLVCQNQSIDDSDAQLAHDLRILVRKRLEAGDTNKQVVDYIVSRYGDFVLLEPPFEMRTLVLWVGPAALLIAGFAGVVVWHRRRTRAADDRVAPLSDEEESRIATLLADPNDK